MVEKDPKSAEILKPILRGRDIKRYYAKWEGMWLIASHNGHDDIPPIAIENYPKIKEHLDKSYAEIERREDQGITPYNLRNCAYHAEFEKEKIVWSDISCQPTFHLLDKGYYINNTAYMISDNPFSKYFISILNSNITKFYFPFDCEWFGR